MWSRDREGLDRVRIARARARGSWIVAAFLGLTAGIAASADAQPEAGQTVYQDACAECHGIRLTRRRPWTGTHWCQLQQRVG